MELTEDRVRCWVLCYRKINELVRLALGKCVVRMSGGWSWLRIVLNGEVMFSYIKVRFLILEAEGGKKHLSSSSSSSSSCSWRVRSVILFLNPQDAVVPSTSSLVVPCSFVLSVYIVMLVLLVYLCKSSVRAVATFSGIVLFPLLYSVLLFFSP